MSRLITQPSVRLVQKQSLVLTQELQLFLKLIQMNTLELKEYLDEQLIENPTLEEIDSSPGEISESKSQDGNNEEIDLKLPQEERNQERDEILSRYVEFFQEGDDDLPSWENRVSLPESLLDHLQWQFDLLDIPDDERQIGLIIVGNTNEDGYLEIGVEEIAAIYLERHSSNGAQPITSEYPQELNEHMASYEGEIDLQLIDTVKRVLTTLQQSLDPPGVCARDLKECLKIQLRDYGFSPKAPVFKIIDHHLEDASNREYEAISKSLDISLDDVEEALTLIATLEPKPGRPFYSRDTEKHIVPDFFVYRVGSELQIQLNNDLPRLRISQYYRNLVKRKAELSNETKKYVRDKLEAAQRIIKCLQERDQTIMKVLKEIIRVQRDFFEYGSEYIKPLRLKDVADVVSVHESTVSRITSKRYIYTPQGTIPLKSLFSRRIETSHGAEVSFERVKSIMKDIVKEEPPEHPYSDEDLSKILERRNIKVARRTVAKYRKILNIPSSTQRAKQAAEKAS